MPYTAGSATPSQIALACMERGHETVFVINPKDAEASAHRLVLQAFGSVIEASHPGEAVEALQGSSPDAVITFAEATLLTTAVIAAAFGLRAHSPEIVAQLTDKLAQRLQLNAKDVGSVRTEGVRGRQGIDQLVDLPLPGVLKPRHGAGSRDTLFVSSRAEVAEELARYSEDATFVVEEYIAGAAAAIHPKLADYVSVESAVVGDDVCHLGYSGRLPLAEPAREGGLVFPVTPPAKLADALYQIASEAIKALGIRHGLVHTEIKIGPNGLQVIEVNARLGGGLASLVSAAGGPDFVGIAIDLALGGTIPLPHAPNRVALHQYVQPPFRAISLEVAPDAGAIRQLAGVYGVDTRARAGDSIDWRRGSAGRILDVWVEAETLEELLLRADAINKLVAETTVWKMK